MNDALVIDHHCFICGKENPYGLKLDIQKLDNPVRACASFVLDKVYQGYEGVIHGGILSSILDELMIYALYFQEIPTMTAKIEVKFKEKVAVDKPLTAAAWMKKDRGILISQGEISHHSFPRKSENKFSNLTREFRGSMVEAEGEIRNAAGSVVTSGSGLFLKVDNVKRL